MKIIIALNNKYIKESLEREYTDVYKYDISKKEDLIELISKEEYQLKDVIVITKESLEGNLDSKLFAKQLRVANKFARVIYIVESIDNEYKKYLFSNEIFTILESENLNLQNLKEAIDEDKFVIYKDLNEDSGKLQVSEAAVDYNYNRNYNKNYNIKNQVIPKKMIAVYGTSGSGKTYVSSIISKNISKDLNLSLVLLDMDIQNPAIDIFNNLPININGLNQIVTDVDRQEKINKLLDKYMIKDKNNKKLWYMTSNTTLFDCQNKLNNKYYDEIYKNVCDKFDYTIIDLPSSPFLDVVPYTLKKADIIYFVVNPNYISIRQAVKYLDLLNKLWDIPKNDIKIIINKIQKNSLDIIQIKSLLSGYDVICEFDFVEELESYINGAKSEIDIDFKIDKLYESLNIENVDKIIKERYKNRYKKYASIIPFMLKKKLGDTSDS